jgi:excisionase family DNA binding protein
VKTYLSVKQVCQRLPVCKTLVYRLVREGVIPSTRIGGKILVLEDGLLALLEGGGKLHGELPPPSPPPRDGRQADSFAAYYMKIMDEVAKKRRR